MNIKKRFLLSFLSLSIFLNFFSFTSFASDSPSPNRSYTYTIDYQGSRHVVNNGGYGGVGFQGYFRFSDFYNVFIQNSNGDPILNDLFYLTNFDFYVVSPNGYQSHCTDFIFRVSNSQQSPEPSFPNFFMVRDGHDQYFDAGTSYKSNTSQPYLFSFDPRYARFNFCTNQVFWSVPNGFDDSREVHFTATFRVFYQNSINDVYSKLVDIDANIDITNGKLDTINSSIQSQISQDKSFRDEDISSANSVSGVLDSFSTSTQDTVKSKWEILWYPIKFTNDLLTVFTGGTTTASYYDEYAFIVGYSFDEDSGALLPVYDYNMYATTPYSDSGGVTITFPAFTLPVLNLKLWDSYSFDLSILKDSFPALFNSLYLVEGCVMVYAFVGFLRDKYEEVFGS